MAAEQAQAEPGAASPDSCDGTALEWTAHPARERPLAAVVAVLVIVAFSVTVTGFGGGRLWGIAAGVVLCLSLNRFFFATRYRADADGVTARFPMERRTLAWDEIRRMDAGSRAAWLSPFSQRTWLEFRRGIHVLYGRDPERVLARLRAGVAGREGDVTGAGRNRDTEQTSR